MTEQTLATSRLHVSDEFDALMERLDAITPLLKANADANEAGGRLTPEVEAALKESGAYKVGIPRSLGGYEFSPRQVIQAIEKISYADASAGWVFMALQMITGTTAAWLPAEATAELFPNGEDYALIAGQGTRLGKAVKADGGYRLSGSWSFASGMHQATHIHTAAFCEETGQALVFTLPKEQATLIDNWDVMGLRATGSIDYVIEDVFVPESYVYEVSTMDSLNGGAIYHLGLANMSGICHTGWALGVARRVLDEMKDLARKKSGAPGATVDTDQFHAAFAQAEAKLRSARALVMETWADNEATLDRGELLSTEQETLTRLTLNNTTWSAHDVVMTVYKWAATAALRSGDLQRFFRDMHAGTQHVTSGPVVLQNCGRHLAGLAPNAHWVFLELQDQ
ncbi:acyl-CoA dehydrogenase family protein [Arthrobacter mangrovi]|uniref:Acyl-CoA dehydrogenase n=1 Tax=Arthrobacter mangrovi TaxID=2966350 RepID=A0ABQ5MPJ7_9MICC|nr:acyl-CoA dehydrogenase family protein [Arthrobacter mangrovi]GLB65909.1 acyl-CoA dehydrogenase [Arthrobacter mangrovi]